MLKPRKSKVWMRIFLTLFFFLCMVLTAKAISHVSIRYPSIQESFRVISSEIAGLSKDPRYENPGIALTDIINHQSLERDSTSEMLEEALNEALAEKMPNQVVPHFELVQLRIEWNENYPGSFREPLSEDLAGQAEADWMISGSYETLKNQEIQLRLELYDMVSEKNLWQDIFVFPQFSKRFTKQYIVPAVMEETSSITENKIFQETEERSDEYHLDVVTEGALPSTAGSERGKAPSYQQNQRGYFSMIFPEFTSPPPPPLSPPPEGMVRIPEGEFVMGDPGGRPDEQPDHLVFIDSFFLDKQEVTNGDYLLCENCERGHGGFDTSLPDKPVVYVDWNNANHYCQSQGKRLPTEAEWEYSAKAGKNNNDSQETNSENLLLYAWNEENTENLGLYGAQEVASKKTSPWGLFDMQGNVMEWVSDFYTQGYMGTFNQSISPKGPETAANPEYPLRVVRGGAWGGVHGAGKVEGMRASRRYAFAPWVLSFQIGFRCAADGPNIQ